MSALDRPTTRASTSLGPTALGRPAMPTSPASRPHRRPARALRETAAPSEVCESCAPDSAPPCTPWHAEIVWSVSTAALRRAMQTTPTAQALTTHPRGETAVVLRLDGTPDAPQLSLTTLHEGAPVDLPIPAPTGPASLRTHPSTGLITLDLPGVLSAVFDQNTHTLLYATTPTLEALGLTGGRYELTAGRLTVTTPEPAAR